jgi:hypothetical protein
MAEKQPGRPRKDLTRQDIERAIKMTKSNKAAARYLHVSFPHYKRWAKLYKNEDGVTLYDSHLNQAGVGIPKFITSKGKEPAIEGIINGTVPVEHFKPEKIKQKLIAEGYLKEECHRCGYREARVFDNKVPLILNFKDKNRHNYNLDNIDMLCYNCSFLYAASPISDEQVAQMESYIERSGTEEHDWELDEAHIEHLRDLGLWEEDNQKPGEEFISRI